MPLLLILSAAAFVSAFSYRILDPLVPALARDLHVSLTSAALLSSAYAFPYALSQPVLGAIGDQLGKERILKVCLGLVALSLAGTVVAPDYGTLFFARCMAGMAGGGIIPVAFAIVADHVPVTRRQSALAQLVMATQSAILLGSMLSGLVAVQLGWRAIFAVAMMVAAVTFALLLTALPSAPRRNVTPFSFEKLRDQYVVLLSNPMAAVILPAAFFEGMAMFGLFPFVAGRLELRGLGGTTQAGLVIGAMSVGGIAYTIAVGQLLRFLGPLGVLRMGAIVSALAMTAIAYSASWQMEAMTFGILGFGFFSIHNSLQLQATELAPNSRATSVALFAFCFFLGQASGPLLYRAGFVTFGDHLPIVIGGLLLFAIGFGVARRLRWQAALQT